MSKLPARRHMRKDHIQVGASQVAFESKVFKSFHETLLESFFSVVKVGHIIYLGIIPPLRTETPYACILIGV